MRGGIAALERYLPFGKRHQKTQTDQVFVAGRFEQRSYLWRKGVSGIFPRSCSGHCRLTLLPVDSGLGEESLPIAPCPCGDEDTLHRISVEWRSNARLDVIRL